MQLLLWLSTCPEVKKLHTLWSLLWFQLWRPDVEFSPAAYKSISVVCFKKCYYSLYVDERGLAEMSLRWQHSCTCKHSPLVELCLNGFYKTLFGCIQPKTQRITGETEVTPEHTHINRPKVNEGRALGRVLTYLFCSTVASLQRKYEAILRMGFEISTFPTADCSVFPGIISKRGRTFIISIAIITYGKTFH